MLNTPREIPYLRAPMYYSSCGQRVEKIAKKLHYKKYQAPVVQRVEKEIHWVNAQDILGSEKKNRLSGLTTKYRSVTEGPSPMEILIYACIKPRRPCDTINDINK